MPFSFFRQVYFFWLFSLFLLGAVSAQQGANIDSLKNILKQIPAENQNKVLVLRELCWQLRSSHIDQALMYGEEGLRIARKINFRKGEADLLRFLGVVHIDYSYDEMMSYFFEALKVSTEINDEEGIAFCHDNLGNAFRSNQDYSKAIENYEKSRILFEKINHSIGLGYVYTHLSSLYREMKKYEEALFYAEKAIKIRKKDKIRFNYTNALYEKAQLFLIQKKYKEAVEVLEEACEIAKIFPSQLGIANYSREIAGAYIGLKDFEKAMFYAQMSEKIARKNKFHVQLNLINETYYKIYLGKGNSAEALQYHVRYSTYKDSTFKELRQKETQKFEQKWLIYKKEKENELLKKDNELHEATIQRQQFISVTTLFGVFLVGILAFIFYKGRKQAKKANDLLSQKNEKIMAIAEILEIAHKKTVKKSKEIELKNQNIWASINYAKRIQVAILPTQDQIGKLLPEHFVLFLPRDVVSGDFYWFSEMRFLSNSYQQQGIIAAIDCTGHGVPGAFMSMIANDLLNEIVHTQFMTVPAQILDRLHSRIRIVLKQKDTGSQDGMDIAICTFDKKEKKLAFAGARSPLYYVPLIENTELHEIKGSRMPVGGEVLKIPRQFEEHTVSFETPTYFYICSDGYQDQFGGTENKKLLSKNLRNLLFSIHHLPCEAQEKRLHDFILNWRGENEQIDDILIMGFVLE